MTEMPLTGRAALITGASQGLGEAIAAAYVAAGADVFLCARDGARLEQTRQALAARASAGQRVLARAADISRDDDVNALVDEAMRELPHLRVLVNNAGV